MTKRLDLVDLSASPPSRRLLIGITLKCGHTVTAYNPPASKWAKFSCTARRGCGYNLPWLTYKNHDTGLVISNPTQVPEESEKEE